MKSLAELLPELIYEPAHLTVLFNKITHEFCLISEEQDDNLMSNPNLISSEFQENILDVNNSHIFKIKVPDGSINYENQDLTELDSETQNCIDIIRKEVIPNSHRFKFLSFENGKAQNIYIIEKKSNNKELPNSISLKEFIKQTFDSEKDYYNRPRIVCNDNFSLSIQGSEYHYCEPRINTDFYTRLEVGNPSEQEGMLLEYAEDEYNPTETVYGYVPIEVLEEVIIKHKGINVKETFAKSN